MDRIAKAVGRSLLCSLAGTGLLALALPLTGLERQSVLLSTFGALLIVFIAYEAMVRPPGA